MGTRSPGLVRPTLDLPPPYTLVPLRESGDAFAHACRIAGETGAGTLVHVGRFDLIEFAVVLEPEEPLRSARRAFFAGMTALADAIGAHCPPDRDLTFAWPDTVVFNDAPIGGGRLGWPETCAEDETPGWLVFSAMLIATHMGGREPGSLITTSLEDEGFGDGQVLVESFARHLMVWFDVWSERGFEPVAKAYLARLPKRKAGESRTIGADGDLVVHGHGSGSPERWALLPPLRTPSWYDPKRGGPKL